MAATSSGYVASNNVNLFDKLLDTLAFSPPAFDIFNVTSSTVAVVTTARPSPTQISPVGSSAEPTEDYVVLPGPEDVLLFNSTNGLYQQSVTLTARMYPIEATAAKSIWGLPTLIWGILIGTIVILIVILATLFFCCWLQPRTRKLLSASYYATTGSNVSHSSIVPKSQTSDSNQLVMPLSIGICPPQYSAPPPPGTSTNSNNSGTNQNQQQQQICPAGSSGIPCHGSNVSPAAVHHGSNKYGSSPHQQQYAHQQQQQQQYHQQQQYQHHHQCIHHQQQQQQQQQQQYQAHYAHLQQQQQHQQQQQSYQQYYNQQQQQHQQQQQQLTQYIHPTQQQALQQQQQQQQREHQIQQQQHHYHHHQKQQQKQQSQLVHHKSMWAINPLYASSGVISDGLSGGSGGGGGGGSGLDGRGDADEEAGSTSYRTRSLPSWGKNKQRPLSNADDLEELYAKVNFSKKRRNRMRNDEAAIIALCRSRSQNLASLPMSDQDAVVVYDERTAL